MEAKDELSFDSSVAKQGVLNKVKSFLRLHGYTITLQDETKPWGAYYYVDEKEKEKFVQEFFTEDDLTSTLTSGLKLTPKILIIQPGELLSWQWHTRRGELWRLVAGEAGYIQSPTDEEPIQVNTLQFNKMAEIPQGTRHRLVGSTGANSKWGIVAEIWKHSDIHNPSNEEDNHRLKDKYSRT